jgi:hypothetical protein
VVIFSCGNENVVVFQQSLSLVRISATINVNAGIFLFIPKGWVIGYMFLGDGGEWKPKHYSVEENH